MIYKKRYLIITAFLIITIQTLLYLNNSQKTSFRYFIWNIQEIKIGKLITFSFVSGLLIGIILNNTKDIKAVNNFSKNDLIGENIDQNKNEDSKEVISDIPPQRDIRDTQPTISVNYRVIKNSEENQNYEENPSNNPKDNDSNDWVDDKSDW